MFASVYCHSLFTGKVGDWINWFTVAQNEEFDKIHNERMKSSKLPFTYRVTKDDQ